MKISDLTPKERAAVKRELAARMKDLVFVQAESKAEDMLKQVEAENPGELDSMTMLDITYFFKMCCGDIIQVVGRMRRRVK